MTAKTKPKVADEIADTQMPAKSKKPIEADIVEETIAIEEKGDEEVPLADELEEAVEEAVMDDEELNPFGDKWEQ